MNRDIYPWMGKYQDLENKCHISYSYSKPMSLFVIIRSYLQKNEGRTGHRRQNEKQTFPAQLF